LAVKIFNELEKVNYTIESVTEEASEFTAEEVRTPERQFGVWRTTTTGLNTLTLDMGSAQALNGLGIIGANYTDVRIIGSPNSNLSSPTYDENATVRLDLLTRRYRLFIDPQTYGGGGFNERYLGIEIASQTPVDNATYFSTGGVVLTTAMETLRRNVREGMALTSSQTVRHLDKINGGFESIKLGELLAQVDMSVRYLQDATDFAQYSKKFVEASNLYWIGLKFSSGEIIDTNVEQYFYLLKTRQDVGMVVNKGTYDMGPILYSEAA
jgi:hypothetical protein